MPIIDGKKIAEEILERLKAQPTPKKFLGVVLVGDDPASVSFIKQKEKIGKELGVDFRLYQFPATMTQDQLRAEVRSIAARKTCGGVIVQLPLPEGINRHYVLNVVPREKDVDVLGERALGAFYANRNPIHPPAVAVVEELVAHLKLDLSKTRMAVIGMGLLVGKPISLYFGDKTEKLETFHLGSGDVKKELHRFNLVVSGAGEAKLFSNDNLGSDTVVIDFGYDEHGGKMVGDFDPGKTSNPHVIYTPTPGGTGPILVTKLYENFYALNSVV